MENLNEIITSLSLYFLGLIVPVVSLVLTFYNQGVEALKKEYQNKLTLHEDNIKDQIDKLKEDNGEKQLFRVYKELLKLKKDSVNKLDLLNIKKQTIINFLLLTLVLILGVIPNIMGDFGYLSLKNYLTITLPVVQVSLMVIIIKRFWGQIGVLIEIKSLLEGQDVDFKKIFEEKVNQTIKLLEELNNSTRSNFLNKIYFCIDRVEIKDQDFILEIVSDHKKTFNISIYNGDSIAAKNVEAGLRFGKEFIFTENGSFSVTTTEAEQIVRWKNSLIHAGDDMIMGKFEVTALKEGIFDLPLFIKGENIFPIHRKIKIKVIKP